MLRIFRIISMIEGISFLLLLFVAMPAKYYFEMPEAVTMVGWAHGILFMLYIASAVLVVQRHKLPDSITGLIMVAGMTPFACFYLEKRLRDERPGFAPGAA